MGPADAGADIVTVDSPNMCMTTEDPGPARGCGAANITLEGNCRCILGYYWVGTRCVPTDMACTCVLGCERLYPTQETCETAHNLRCRGG